MTLATAGTDRLADARMLILKDAGERGFAFASTASSRKGSQVRENPAAALNFWWQPQTRAVRVQGPVVEADAAESAADLAARSPEAQSLVAEGDLEGIAVTGLTTLGFQLLQTCACERCMSFERLS